MKKFLLVCLTMFCLACSGMVVSASDVESKPLATVTMPAEKVAVYTGKAIFVEEAGTTETTGAISYHYYIDSECTVATTYANAGAATTGSAPVKPGIYYVVAIAAEDETYQESTSNTCMLVICPKKVTGVKASLVKKGVKLTWNKRPEADGYLIFRQYIGGAYEQVATITKNSKLSYTEKRSGSSAKIRYEVVAYKMSGDTYVIGEKGVANKLVSYMNITATNRASDVKLEWSTVSGAKKYNIYRKTKGDSKFKKVATVKKNVKKWIDKSGQAIVNGRKSVYYVEAVFPKKAKTIACSTKLTNYYLARPKITGSTNDLVWTKNSKASGYLVETTQQGFSFGSSKEVYYDEYKANKVKNYYGKEYDQFFPKKARVCAYKIVGDYVYFSAWTPKKGQSFNFFQ